MGIGGFLESPQQIVNTFQGRAVVVKVHFGILKERENIICKKAKNIGEM